MEKIVGIRFKQAGKIYNFNCGAFVLQQGDHVIVETENGLGMGIVATPPEILNDQQRARVLKKVFRMASKNDFAQKAKNLDTENKAYKFCLNFINDLGLEMNLFAVEASFDASKLTFFFTSEGRVDFRQLVKMLVKKLETRIEMRQVGIRNQAKMCGGIGRCGNKICCSTFMNKFVPVSIRMAKDQGLSLNPSKISGQCGRLMCCLTFEYNSYKEFKSRFPKIGKPVKTKNGNGKIIRHNVLRDRITVRLDDGSEIEAKTEDIIDK